MSSEMVKKYMKYKNVGIFGTPMKIDTNYENQKTDVLFSAKNLTLPQDPVLREKVLKNLAVYVVHSDGDKEILPARLAYDDNGILLGAKITIDKFSTFNFISIINTAPSVSKLSMKKADPSGKIFKVTYIYQDVDKDKEGNTKYQWYRSDNKAGKSKTKINSATKSSYAITKKDFGKYLICEVVPCAKDGVIAGKSYLAVKYVPKQKTVQKTSGKEDAAANKVTANTAAIKGANADKTSMISGEVKVKLGLVGNEKYAKLLADIFRDTYKASNAEVKEEGSYYRVSAEFSNKELAKKACQEMKHNNFILNYYVLVK